MNPMSLKNLPEHLKSVREKGDSCESPLVNVGQIVDADVESGFMRWSKKIALAASICMVLAVGGILTYDSMNQNQYTIIVDAHQGANISQIVSESGGQIVSINQTNDGTYEVTITSEKSRRSFLEWFRKNRDIRKAE